MSDILLFVTGGLLDSTTFESRCISPQKLGIACLPNWRLGFFGHSEVWDGAEDTPITAPGCETWGMLYCVRPRDLDRLDYFQGVRLDGRGAYFHYPVEVRSEDGAVSSALVYRKDVLGPETPPSAEYLALIVQGAQAHHLPLGFVRSLTAIPSHPASYPVPLYAASPDFAGACAC